MGQGQSRFINIKRNIILGWILQETVVSSLYFCKKIRYNVSDMTNNR